MLDEKSKSVYNNFNKLSMEEKILLMKDIMADVNRDLKACESDMSYETMLSDFVYQDLNLLQDLLQFHNYDNILNNFNKLNDKRKTHVLKQLFVSIRDNLIRQEQDENEKYCRENGHDYDEWYEIPAIKEKHTYLDTSDYHHWERTCRRCGHVESSLKKPKEYKKAKKK